MLQPFAGISIALPGQNAEERGALMKAALVLTLGVAAVVCDCLHIKQPPILNLHLLFGICLWISIASCLVRQGRMSGPGSAQSYHEYSRHLSRWVYILLYVMAGVRLSFHLGGLLSLAAHGRPAVADPHSLDDFQIYIAYALVPLWTMRFLTMQWRRRICADAQAAAGSGKPLTG